ncbi:gamma-butyrobetaine dioxygenase-like isoform X2 [Schistocerca nitens]|uniref:gamma-butyrobetaine dioxygenase-like isoform X2 n=1 Tax=Schistocerca nitens TaxID=7011 RepID=UPI002117DA16|nr:gamma-butyrobetaine dioxygenase-like isoform X2 [Schistocerca nitens]XP_049792673.1 gamma-butyrobetaine dioxygenase-like isoform X2 [Schistocerca nitens]
MLRNLVASASRSLVSVGRKSRLVSTQTGAAAQQHPKPVATVDGELVSLQLPSGEHHKFPIMWLRDNCQCPKCFNSQQMSRIIYWDELDTNVKPADIQADGEKLSVKWSDGHSSQYTLEWLQNRSFHPEDQKKWLDETYRLPKAGWNAENFESILQRFKYSDVVNSQEHFRGWLEAMAKYGVAIMYDTPPTVQSLRELGDKVMYPRMTHYGLQYHLKIKPDATNVAFLSDKLEMHTDLMYCENKPGINLLHCVVQTKGDGGDNLLADGYYLSEKLKVTNPEAYKTLSTVRVTWSDVGKHGGKLFYFLYRTPVITNDLYGEFVRINYSQPQRSSHFTAPLDQVVAWYKAYDIFTKELNSPKNQARIKTRPGEILIFDNIRLIHGRAGYDDKPGNERHIIGQFLDWDEVFSRLRVLRKEAGLIKY